mmetsp:Transcript_59783/g.117269  ORF Transcript_59783/g.117269 Transcript_59783/m.117269 type:complete len:560 (+) Transcript_59783:96-1775(+)
MDSHGREKLIVMAGGAALLLGGVFIGWVAAKKQTADNAKSHNSQSKQNLSLDKPPLAPLSPKESPRSDLAITSRLLNQSWLEKARSRKAAGVEPLSATRNGSSSGTRLAALTTPPSKTKYVLAMVGLPARGKSYIVKMILRYLRWTGIKAEIFNVGNYRRKMDFGGVAADFFDKSNEQAQRQREQLALDVQDDMYRWLHAQDDLAVAFFDATNTTRARREAITKRAILEPNVFLLFVESICDDPDILERNYHMKLQNSDYKDQDPSEALFDFKDRVTKYEAVYEECVDDEVGGKISYIKLYNVGQKVVTHRCSGYIPSHVAFHLMNVHISPRKIWLSRHSESPDQVRGRLGGDSGVMTNFGVKYAKELCTYIKKKMVMMKQERANNGEDYRGDELVVMLGTQAIHHSTVESLREATEGDPSISITFMYNSLLNELRAGELDTMTHSEIKRKFPGIWEERMKDRLHFRYPGAGGESYIDLIQRIKPVIVELERQRKSVLVVSHLAVQRCLCAYFSGLPIEEIPFLKMPTHVVTELSIEPHGTTKTLERLADATTVDSPHC